MVQRTGVPFTHGVAHKPIKKRHMVLDLVERDRVETSPYLNFLE